MSQLRAQQLKKRYKSRVVVKDVSLEVSSGEVIGLLGPNGAGKTTCFYMMVGLVPLDGGEIHLDDKRLTHMPIHRARAAGVVLPAAGSLDFPPADGRRKRARGARTAVERYRRRLRSNWSSC